MDYEPVDVPREVGWRGTANRLVIWLAHRPWTAVGGIAGAVFVVVLPSWGMASGAWADLPPQVDSVLGFGAVGVIAGALVFVDALLGRTGRTYLDGVTLAAIAVLLPLAITVSSATALALNPTERAGSLESFLVATSVVAGVAVASVGTHRLVCLGRAIEFRRGDWLVYVAWWVALVGGGACLAETTRLGSDFVSATTAAILALPLLTRARSRQLWLAVPAALAAAHAGSILMRCLAGFDPWAHLGARVLLSLPPWIGFFLGAAPFVFLARRAHRMSVLPPWE